MIRVKSIKCRRKIGELQYICHHWSIVQLNMGTEGLSRGHEKMVGGGGGGCCFYRCSHPDFWPGLLRYLVRILIKDCISSHERHQLQSARTYEQHSFHEKCAPKRITAICKSAFHHQRNSTAPAFFSLTHIQRAGECVPKKSPAAPEQLFNVAFPMQQCMEQ